MIKTYAGLAHDAGVMDDGTALRIGRIRRLSGRTAERINQERRDQGQATRKGYKKASAVYFEEEHQHLLTRLLASIDPSTPQGARDLVALLLLYDLGLRPGEVIALRLSDLDLPRKQIHVHRYKTGLQQYLMLSDPLKEAITAYVRFRRDWTYYQARLGEQTNAPLLVQSRKNKTLLEACDLEALRRAEQEGGRSVGMWLRSHPRKRPLPASADWSTQHLWDWVYQLSLAAGLPPLAPYDVRHQWTYEAVTGGTPHPVILQAGGWKSGPCMVERYHGRHEVANKGIRLKRNREEKQAGKSGERSWICSS